jgi:hypothetical protein
MAYSQRIKNVFQANGPHKQAGVAILISDKLDKNQLEETMKVTSY